MQFIFILTFSLLLDLSRAIQFLLHLLCFSFELSYRTSPSAATLFLINRPMSVEDDVLHLKDSLFPP